MFENIASSERWVGGWRAVAAAWVVVIALVALFAAAEALASRPDPAPRLAGAEIPRHDPGFAGPDEVAASDWLEQAKVEAYSCW
jgi:hypothetical protein